MTLRLRDFFQQVRMVKHLDRQGDSMASAECRGSLEPDDERGQLVEDLLELLGPAQANYGGGLLP